MPPSSTATPTIHQRRAITFRRKYWDDERVPADVVNKQYQVTFPFDSDDAKVRLVDKLVNTPEEFSKFFICGFEVRRTKIAAHTVDGQDGATTATRFYPGVQLWVSRHYGDLSAPSMIGFDVGSDDEDEDHEGMGELSVSFKLDTRADKLKMAHWIATKRFDGFLVPMGGHVYLSSIADVEPVEEPVEERPAVLETLRAVSDALFEHKEAMPEATYLTLSNALKRSHSAI